MFRVTVQTSVGTNAERVVCHSEMCVYMLCVCVRAGVLPSDGSQRDGRADVHSAADVQTDQEAEARSAEICREADRRGSRQQAGVRGENTAAHLNVLVSSRC